VGFIITLNLKFMKIPCLIVMGSPNTEHKIYGRIAEKDGGCLFFKPPDNTSDEKALRE